MSPEITLCGNRRLHRCGRQHRDVEGLLIGGGKRHMVCGVVACDEMFGVSDGSYQRPRPDVEIPPGSESRACTQGVPRESGRPSRLHGGMWYHRARQRSEVGWARGSRSTSEYLRSRGTRPRGPCGGKGVPRYGTAGGKDGGNIESHNRLNGTSADSGMGA